MLTKSQQKLINSLQTKKYRNKNGLFVVEGIKGISEFLNSKFVLQHLFATEDLFGIKYHPITELELRKISFLKNPNKALALFSMTQTEKIKEQGIIVALDNVRDPGNLGTIIRLCDWFGVTNLLCDEGTVDCYNPKVVQATMGSLTRVNLHYLNLQEFLHRTTLPIMGAFMEGNNIYNATLANDGILVMGNEANGISDSISEIITQKLAIPSFSDGESAESLNVATATAILLSEFRRRSY